MEDLGVASEVQVNTHLSPATSITSRRCAKRKRRIEVRELWVQDRVAKGEPPIVKVGAEENVADGLTKHVDLQKMEQPMAARSMVQRSGRHELGPQRGDIK